MTTTAAAIEYANNVIRNKVAIRMIHLSLTMGSHN